MKTDAEIRKAALAKIHMAKAQLGMAEDDYRAMLQRVAGVRSAALLLPAQADAVLAELRRFGFRDRGADYGGLKQRYARAGNERLMASIRRMLAATNRPWSYADAMAKRMCGIDRLEWCGYESLQKIHTALKMDERRRAKNPSPHCGRGVRGEGGVVSGQAQGPAPTAHPTGE